MQPTLWGLVFGGSAYVQLSKQSGWVTVGQYGQVWLVG